MSDVSGEVGGIACLECHGLAVYRQPQRPRLDCDVLVRAAGVGGELVGVAAGRERGPPGCARSSR
jgi:hypothetical protein